MHVFYFLNQVLGKIEALSFLNVCTNQKLDYSFFFWDHRIFMPVIYIYIYIYWSFCNFWQLIVYLHYCKPWTVVFHSNRFDATIIGLDFKVKSRQSVEKICNFQKKLCYFRNIQCSVFLLKYLWVRNNEPVYNGNALYNPVFENVQMELTLKKALC